MIILENGQCQREVASASEHWLLV